MFRSSNPTLNPKFYSQARSFGVGESMTIQGTVNKCFILLFLIFVSASWVWGKFMQAIPAFGGEQAAAESIAAVMPFVQFGGIIALVLIFVTVFKLQWSPITAPLYAVCQGFALGGFSAIIKLNYPGIAIQAILLTFGTLFALLMAYKTGFIKVTQKFRLGVISAFFAIFAIKMVDFIMGIFGANIPFIHGSSMVSIGFSLVVVGIAALFLVLDFDRIDKFSSQGLPKYMEWYGALSLMITLVWLYVELLVLLSKLRGRR